MAIRFDMEETGTRRLRHKLKRLPKVLRNRIVGVALKAGARMVHTEMLLNLSGRIVQERTGNFVNAMEKQKPKIMRQSHFSEVRVVAIELPDRPSLGIKQRADGGGDSYPPGILEYGSRFMAAFAWARRSADDNADRFVRIVRRTTKKLLIREARRK